MIPAALALLLAGSASAASLDLMTVQAHHGPGPSDPAAEVAARELRSRGYQRFTVDNQQRVDLSVGEGAILSVGESHSVRVKLLNEVGDVVRVKVRLVHNGAIEVDMVARLRGASPLLLRAEDHGNADVFAVVVQPPASAPPPPARPAEPRPGSAPLAIPGDRPAPVPR